MKRNICIICYRCLSSGVWVRTSFIRLLCSRNLPFMLWETTSLPWLYRDLGNLNNESWCQCYSQQKAWIHYALGLHDAKTLLYITMWGAAAVIWTWGCHPSALHESLPFGRVAEFEELLKGVFLLGKGEMFCLTIYKMPSYPEQFINSAAPTCRVMSSKMLLGSACKWRHPKLRSVVFA